MGYRVWYSTESLADYIIDNTGLSKVAGVEKRKMYESDANNAKNFHALPDHIKQILYLDAPDLIVEKDLEPIFSIEISTEAGTGHNAFQRFSRIAASIEKSVPAFYIYPEAAIIHRQEKTGWDRINPLIFQALIKAMDIYQIPALLYFFPTDYHDYKNKPEESPNIETKGLKYDADIIKYAACPDSSSVEMLTMFESMDSIIDSIEIFGVISSRNKIIRNKTIVSKRDDMLSFYHQKGQEREWSPITSTIIVPTSKVINYISNFHELSYEIGDLLRSREETIIYKVNAKFRGDPYPGALAAIDYLLAREGKTFEERYYNLVLAWGDVSESDTNIVIEQGKSLGIESFFTQVSKSEKKSNILHKNFAELKNEEIPRYYMQVRYGSMFSKVKHIRVYSYFADAILFYNGALWRDG